MHVRFEITQFADVYFLQTVNYRLHRPIMLQMKSEPNLASGFNLSLREMFESVDRQQTTMDNYLSFVRFSHLYIYKKFLSYISNIFLILATVLFQSLTNILVFNE